MFLDNYVIILIDKNIVSRMYYYELFGRFVYLGIFLLGLSVGSFLNSWIWRTRENFKIISGRSMCPVCRRQLKWYENIPLLSFVALQGRCRTCKYSIPTHYIMVELSTAFIFVLLAWQNLNSSENYLYFLRNIMFAILLIVIFVYDFLYQEILSEVVWFGALIGLFFAFYFGQQIAPLLIGAAVAGGFFLLQFVISKGRWIGGGDVRLGVMMGLWLGWPVILVALFIGYISGAISGALLHFFKKRTWQSATPFGTHLAMATFICLIWGKSLLNWYMGLL